MVGIAIVEERRRRCDQGTRRRQRRGASLAHWSWLSNLGGDFQPRKSATCPLRHLTALCFPSFRHQALGPRRGERTADLLDESSRAIFSEDGRGGSDEE